MRRQLGITVGWVQWWQWEERDIENMLSIQKLNDSSWLMVDGSVSAHKLLSMLHHLCFRCYGEKI